MARSMALRSQMRYGAPPAGGSLMGKLQAKGKSLASANSIAGAIGKKKLAAKGGK